MLEDIAQIFQTIDLENDTMKSLTNELSSIIKNNFILLINKFLD
jgi:hypothetical protein